VRASGSRPLGEPGLRGPTSSSPAAIPTGSTRAALNVGAQRTAAFDAYDTASLESFFEDLPTPIDHVMVTAGGPNYVAVHIMSNTALTRATYDIDGGLQFVW
jgi:hypothetical protein